MKKFIALMLCLLAFVCLSACDIGDDLTEEHVHTGKWVEYNQYEHYYMYTCGCTIPNKTEKHVYNDGDTFCNICGYDRSDEPPLVDETVFLKDYATWLAELNAENVAEIKTIFEYVGVAPGRLKDISRTTDKTVITDMLDKYANVEMRSVAREETYISGGSAFTIEFALTDGTMKQLYFNNGFYAYGLDQDEISALCHFELCSVPTLKDYANVTKSYGFITYLGTGTVYDKDNNPVCEIPIDALEFVAFDGDLPAVITGYYYTVDTVFGTLWFTYRNDLFYLRFEGEENSKECYQLVGKNLDELISKYTTNLKPHSISYMSDRTAELLMAGFVPTEANSGDTVLLRTNPIMDADLTFYANGVKLTKTHADSDYWEYIFTMPDEDVVITHEITDGFLIE